MIYLYFLSLLLFLFFVVILQTTILHDLFGTTVHIWLALSVYIAIYKNLKLNLFWIYLTSFTFLIFSASIISYFLIGQIVLLFGIKMLVKKIFYNDVKYFISTYVASALLFYFTISTLAFILNDLPFGVGSNFVLQIILTCLNGFIVFYIMKLLDKIKATSN